MDPERAFCTHKGSVLANFAPLRVVILRKNCTRDRLFVPVDLLKLRKFFADPKPGILRLKNGFQLRISIYLDILAII